MTVGLSRLLHFIKARTRFLQRGQREPINGLKPFQESLMSECPPDNENTLCRLKLHPNITRREVAADREDQTKKFSALHSSNRRMTEGWIFKVVSGLDAGRQYIATTPLVKIGRKSDNHIYLKDPKVSRYHALITIRGDQLYIKDLGSTNGTKVNDGKVFGERELFAGELIQLGDTVIQLERVSFCTSDAL